ncbi:MAG: DUF2238 domain-containing protein [Candidatus Pacebacteria bacterium]|nr:DUF2238 domain-containing protein [Candidatus Paceibacterota bacterium]
MKKIQKVLLSLNVLIIISFGYYYSTSFNFEFIAYVGLIAVITALLFGTLKTTKFTNGILFGITIWALLHMLGGSVETEYGVLYAYKIFPIFDGGGEFYILKFDQIVHTFLYGVVGLMFLHLLRNFIGIKTNKWLVAFIAIFASAGFSIINEIIEFAAVVILPETGVGGYYNTVLDLIFNLLGSVVAVIFYSLKTLPDKSTIVEDFPNNTPLSK